MKSLVIYYSWTGNTEVVAKEIHQQIGGDLKKIEEVKQRKSGIGFAGATFSALVGVKSRLKPMNFTFNDYEDIFLGTPVWAARSTPAINTFLSRAILKDKKVHLFLTKADDKTPQKVIDSITKKRLHQVLYMQMVNRLMQHRFRMLILLLETLLWVL